MTKKFRITLNGTSYEVEVEELGSSVSVAPVAHVAAPTVAPAPVAAPAAPVAQPSAPAGNGEPVCAPMPGKITNVKVAAGQNVKAGDILFILEAMKMENEIVAPKDCTVVSINANVGSNVSTGDVLATIK